MEPTKKKILCVDDDEDDRLFLSLAIGDVNPSVSVVEAKNGMEAMDYLNAVKKDGSTLPCLIILDINMPYLDGKQTFLRIKEDPSLNRIPIVVFTNSENPNDKNHFKTYGVEMVTKPDNVEYMNRIAGNFLNYCSIMDN